MIVIIIWILFAFWAGNIAEKKGRSYSGWFVLGLLFGIFAVAAVLLAGNKLKK